ncbi:hypothetical protein OEZ86_008048 [Tetradesmus obliquus]|nr:hypothetical protein OEZ86_008048 [Tetradesmus obliquus]
MVQPSQQDVAASRAALQQFLASPEVAAEQARLQQQQQQQRSSRGILVVAGGRKLTTHLVVLLKVLRQVLHCSLPVEVAWQGRAEMDNSTLAALQQQFGPLSGFDVTTAPYPKHLRRVPLQRWVGKVAALLHCSFAEVLLLDSDNLPLTNPGAHFEDPLYKSAGNLFWPDFWSDWVGAGAWPILGLNRTAVQPLLSAGAGWSGRDAESGMLLLDRARWLSVLHWVLWVNTWHDRLYYRHLHGDKDTFALGFALAGAADQYMQVSVPPGGVFRWGSGQLEVKCAGGSCNTTDGWQLMGALQHDNYARPAFFHRTMNKMQLGEQPWPAELLTGPLPQRWLRYYLAHNSQGPTKGVWWEHVAPPAAFQQLHIDPLPLITVPSAAGSSWQQVQAHTRLPVQAELARRHTAGSGHGGSSSSSSSSSGKEQQCPLVLLSQYMQAVQLGLPIDRQPNLECNCRQVLDAIISTVHEHNMGELHWAAADAAGLASSSRYWNASVADSTGQLVPDGGSVAALRCSGELAAMSSTLRVIKESVAALQWLQREGGRAAFPSLFDGSMA